MLAPMRFQNFSSFWPGWKSGDSQTLNSSGAGCIGAGHIFRSSLSAVDSKMRPHVTCCDFLL